MCNQNLTPAARLERKLWEQMYRQNDEDRLYADLTGLYAEIIRVIGISDKPKSLIIYDYAKLLEQELQLYSSADAYIAGAKGGKRISADDTLSRYLCEVSQKNSALGLDAKIFVLYSEISGLLGNNKGLIEEFTQTYCTVHGTVKRNIEEFIRLGHRCGKAVPA